MNPSPLGPLPFLGEFLVKSVLLVLVGTFLTRFVRSLSPSQKHSIWICVFSVGILAPMALLTIPRWGILPGIADSLPPSNTAVTTHLPLEPVSPPELSTPLAESPPPSASQSFDVSKLLLLIWLSGSAILLIRSLLGAFLVHQLCKARVKIPSRVASLFEELVNETSKRPTAKLILSPNLSSPFTAGLFRPKVVLPADSVEWSGSTIRMVLSHELSHVHRRDTFAAALSQCYLALHWINPLSWYAVRSVTHLREEACDQQVVEAGFESSQYAEMLLQQASQPQLPLLHLSAPAVADTTTIEKRITNILKQDPTMNPKSKSAVAASILALFSLSIAAAISVAGPNDPFGGPEVKELTIQEKLDSLTLPKVEFNDTPFSDAIDFLQKRSMELDSTSDENKKGVNVIIADESAKEAQITLRLVNVPLGEAIRYTANLAGSSYQVDKNAVVIVPLGKPTDLFTKAYTVESSKLFGAQGANRQTRPAVTEVLTEKGIHFGEGASAVYNDGTSQLIVRNTREHMDRLETLIRKLGGARVTNAVATDSKTAIKLREIQFPAIEFVETPIRDALDFIQKKSMELDSDQNPNTRGINLILENADSISDQRINLRLRNVPLAEVLRYTTTLANAQSIVEENGVVIRPN